MPEQDRPDPIDDASIIDALERLLADDGDGSSDPAGDAPPPVAQASPDVGPDRTFLPAVIDDHEAIPGPTIHARVRQNEADATSAPIAPAGPRRSPFGVGDETDPDDPDALADPDAEAPPEAEAPAAPSPEEVAAPDESNQLEIDDTVHRFDPPAATGDRMFRSVPPREQRRRGGNLTGFRRTVATLLRERRRIVLSTIIVALGVAYLAGSLSLLHRVDQGLSNLSGAGTERADLVVEGAISYDSPLEQVRQLVPASLTTVIESIDGVAATDPRIEDTAVIVGPDNEPIVPLGITERPAGASWPTVPELSPYQFVGEGAPPLTEDEVAIDETTANAGDLRVGDQVGIITKSTFGTYTITGVVTLDGAPMPPGSSLALFEIDTARQLFDREDDVNAIGVLLEEGASVSETQAQIQAAMPPSVEVSTPAVYEQHRQTSLAKSFTLIEILLLGFAGLAVVVGAFTVANSNALLFARRRRGFALLRLVGASPRQLLGSAMVEAALVGVLAVVVGLPLGLLAGAAIEQAIGALGAAIPTAGSAVSPSMLAIAAVVGMAVTVATAVAPAWDAARTTPVAALNRNDERRERGAPWAARVGGWLLVGAVIGAVVGAVLSDGLSGPAVGAAIGAGVFALLALLPPVLGGLIALTTRLMVGRSRTLRSLTALRSRRARSRASSTTAALMIATLVIASLSTLSASFVSSISGEVQEAVTADLVVDSGTFTRGGLPADLVDELEQADGVASATGVRLGRANVAGYSARLSAIDGDDVFEVLDLGVANQPPALAADEIAISDEFAQSTGTTVGQTVTVDFVNAVQPVTVTAIYTKGSALLGDGIIDTSVLERTTPTSVDLLALVALEPGREAEGTANTTSIAESYGVTQVLAPQELVDERAELLSGFQRVIEWMLLFSVGLAVIGVANTLQLSVNERRRELGLLRAVGASRRQVIRLVLVEAGALSVVGAVLGIALGVGLAFGAVTALSDLGLDKFALPVLALAATAVTAVVLGLSGALLPALRASGAGILEAIGEDEDSSTTMLSRISQFRIRRRSRSLMTGPSRAGRVYREATPAPPPGDGAAEPDADTEETMATRCYNCGNDPGSGDRCQVCDASQIPEPLGMFSTAPAAAGTQPPRPAAVDPTTQSRQSAGLWSTGDDAEEPAAENGHRTQTTDERFADIVDAAIVDDDDVYESHRDRPRESAPHAPRDEAPLDDRREAPREPAEEHSAQLGSIFDGDPGDATRSPFGRHANDAPSEPEWSPEWSPEWPAEEAPPARPAPAPQPQPQYQVPPPSYPPPPPPPNPYVAPNYAQTPGVVPAPYYQHPYQVTAGPPAAPTDQFAQAGVGAPQTGPNSTPVTPDQQGLAAAVSKLAPASQHSGTVAFCVVGGLLAADEVVLTAVQGWALGMPTVAVLTNARVLVVSERRWKPLVEAFSLRPGLTIFGRHVDHQASVTFQEGDRVVTLDQVADVPIAVELATTARARSTGTGF